MILSDLLHFINRSLFTKLMTERFVCFFFLFQQSNKSSPESNDGSPIAAFPSLSSSASLSSRASKMSASAMSVIAATMKTNPQVKFIKIIK